MRWCVCSWRGLTSWTEACWKRGIRGLVLGMSMWICREKERKKKDKHWSNGQVSTDLAITDSDRNGEREEQLVDWCLWLKSDWGFSFLKWIAAVVLNAALHMSALACWDASTIICACINVCVCVYACTRPHLHHFRVFTPQTTDTTGGQIHQKGARRMQGGSWSQANWNSPVCL